MGVDYLSQTTYFMRDRQYEQLPILLVVNRREIQWIK
jgi:hypothetical protein